jgi:predicted DNA-binding ArsR family transcriptional regulator
LENVGYKIIKINTWSYPTELAGIIKHVINSNKNKSNTQIKPERIINSNNTSMSSIKKIKHFLFDKLFCTVMYRFLNFNNRGSILEVLAQKI